MKFYCAEDIENLAAQGRTELVLDDDTVLTDLARDMARQLGISLVHRSRSPLAKGAPATPPPSRSSTVALGPKPKGCQHGPLTSSRPDSMTASGGPNAVVDQLVGLVKQLGTGSGS